MQTTTEALGAVKLDEETYEVGRYRVVYEVSYEEDGLPWVVYSTDAEGAVEDELDAFEAAHEAIEDATAREEEARQEEAEERLAELRDEVGDLVADCEDPAVLERVLALLKQA